MSLDEASQEELNKFVESNVGRFTEEFRTLIRQPSVSSQNRGVKECSELVEKMMLDLGVQTRIYQCEEGFPIVYGELGSSSSKKTLLIYSHYDVQPPEPLELWKYPPFSAEIQEGIIYGRGSSDTKGNLFAYLKAVEVLQRISSDIPVNLKFLFEGEEEIGSPHLPDFVEENKKMLKADATVVADEGLHETGAPILSLGVKGLLMVQFDLETSDSDHHSMRAPLVPNPAWRLVWVLNTIKNMDERIQVEGWYDRVIHPTEEERELMNEIPFNEEEIKKLWGVQRFIGDSSGLEAVEKLVFQPTANIAGFDSGYKGTGSKTVLPSRAMVKIDFRLVSDQSSDELFKKLKAHIHDHGFSDIRVSQLGAVEPSKTPIDAPIVEVVRDAAEKVYDLRPVIYPNMPGSGPDYVFTKLLGLDSVWTGCSSPSSNIHSPNEFTTVDDFTMGIKYAATVIQQAEEIPESK